MPDRKIPLAERILARCTNADRAAAIYGDLLELAATRGRLWFVVAYARTFVTLTWRTAAAFLAGCASLTALYQLWEFYLRHTLRFGWWHGSHPHIHLAVFYLTVQLWFIVPFAIARYGLRDPLVRLGVPAMLLMTGVLCNVPFLSLIFAAVGIVAIVASLAFASSRPPATTLIATTVLGAITLLNLGFLAHLACWINEHKPLNASSGYHFFEIGFAFPHTLFWVVVWTMTLVDITVVFSRIRRWRPKAPDKDYSLA